MESEFQILDNIEKNNTVTQRDIAKNTGMSLGNVNTLIKRLVKKGFLKMERLNAKTIRYILTPKGIKEKAERTYTYIVESYKYFNEINHRIEAVISSHLSDGTKQVYLFGNKDEIYELLKDKFHQLRISHELIQSCDNLRATDNSIILTWHPDYTEILESKGIPYVNLLDAI